MAIIAVDGMVISDQPPIAWVDTNVMLEVYTFGDIIHAKRTGTAAEVEVRRVRMQGTLWMAMALCQQSALTLSYSHEGTRNFAKHCPPGSDLYEWSRLILFVLHDGGVFAGWTDATTSTGSDLGNGPRDTRMAELCAGAHPMTLITWDPGAARKARARSARAVEPQEYAAEVLVRSLAERLFMARLDIALARYVESGPPEQRDVRSRKVRGVRPVYEYIWKPFGPAEPFSAEP